MIDVSIIIVSYNTENFLRDCLQSIEDSNLKLSYEVIVVDNDSSDNSVAMVKKEFPNVLLIENNHNLGFSKANNKGVEKANGRYILFLNSDTKINKQMLPTMVSFMDSHEKAGAATCYVALPNGQIDDASHRGFPTPWNAFCHFSGLAKIIPYSTIFNGYNLGWKDLDKIHKIDALAGAFMIVRRQAGNDINWWDEDYFFYGEDLDFCYMLKEKGWDIYFVPKVSVLHYKGVSGGIKKASQEITTATKETRQKVTKARFSAMRIFYKKHYETTYPWIITRAVYLGISIKEWIVSRSI